MINAPKKILILAANPLDTVHLRVSKEVEEIRQTLRLSDNRDQFVIESRQSVRPNELQQYMYDIQPQIIHFSGHGSGNDGLVSSSVSRQLVADKPNTDAEESGLVFEDAFGQSHLVSGTALANLCALFDDNVSCVVLNACYSQAQANEIVQHIPYVIGMSRSIGDDAARQFSQGFYRAIWAERSIEEAFASGVNAIELQGGGSMSEELTPVLLRRSDFKSLDLSPSNLESGDASLESPEGQVRPESNFYIPSIYEDRGYKEVQKFGSLIRIKSPNHMGKSSLMLRVLQRARQLNYRTVVLDLGQANQKFFADQDKFMQWFCASIGKQLDVRVKVEEYWDDIFGANDNSTEYFQKYLLEVIEQPLVVAIDNFDRVFEYPDIEIDFCGLLRGWHERAKVKEIWNNLRLIIVHSQETYAQKRDINQSPFNIGLAIELDEFTAEQVQELVRLHRLDWTDQEVKQLMSLIGGHPYLVRLALYHIASGDETLDGFLKKAPTEAGVYRNYLASSINTLEKYPELGKSMKAVVMSDTPVRLRSEEAFKLTSLGLVVRTEYEVRPRCLLYRKYFREWLGR
jgi:AAA-like domain/CHAT domain